MVDEGALEHVVDLAQVVLVGHSVAVRRTSRNRRRPSPSGRGAPARPRRGRPGGSSATRCAPSRSRSRPATGAGARRRRTRRCRSAGRRARGPRRPPGPGRPPTRRGRRSRLSARSSGRSRSTMWTKSIRPSARSWTLPQARISPSASRTTTFSRVRSPCSETSTRTSSTPSRPSRGRAARGRAAGGSAGRRRTGRRDRGADRPARRQAGNGALLGADRSTGSVSNRVSSGITVLILPYAVRRPTGPRVSAADGLNDEATAGLPIRSGSALRSLRGAIRRGGVPGWRATRPSSARSTSSSCSSSATRTIASAARSSASASRPAVARPWSSARSGAPGLGVELAGGLGRTLLGRRRGPPPARGCRSPARRCGCAWCPRTTCARRCGPR